MEGCYLSSGDPRQSEESGTECEEVMSCELTTLVNNLCVSIDMYLLIYKLCIEIEKWEIKIVAAFSYLRPHKGKKKIYLRDHLYHCMIVEQLSKYSKIGILGPIP